MKLVSAVLSLSLVCAAQLVQAQQQLPPMGLGSEARARMAEADQRLLVQADNTKRKIANSVEGYLVAYNASHVDNRWHVGVPLASFSDTGLSLAYDLSGKNVMAQWKFAQKTIGHNVLEYKAYLGDAGNANLVISSRF